MGVMQIRSVFIVKLQQIWADTANLIPFVLSTRFIDCNNVIGRLFSAALFLINNRYGWRVSDFAYMICRCDWYLLMFGRFFVFLGRLCSKMCFGKWMLESFLVTIVYLCIFFSILLQKDNIYSTFNKFLGKIVMVFSYSSEINVWDQNRIPTVI